MKISTVLKRSKGKWKKKRIDILLTQNGEENFCLWKFALGKCYLQKVWKVKVDLNFIFVKRLLENLKFMERSSVDVFHEEVVFIECLQSLTMPKEEISSSRKATTTLRKDDSSMARTFTTNVRAWLCESSLRKCLGIFNKMFLRVVILYLEKKVTDLEIPIIVLLLWRMEKS